MVNILNTFHIILGKILWGKNRINTFYFVCRLKGRIFPCVATTEWPSHQPVCENFRYGGKTSEALDGQSPSKAGPRVIQGSQFWQQVCYGNFTAGELLRMRMLITCVFLGFLLKLQGTESVCWAALSLYCYAAKPDIYRSYPDQRHVQIPLFWAETFAGSSFHEKRVWSHRQDIDSYRCLCKC